MGYLYRIILLILVPVFLHSPSTALQRYPDPFSCQKYYIRLSDTNFSSNTCPNKYVFNPAIEKCVNLTDYPECGIEDRPKVTFIGLEEICNNILGYYCSSTDGFTYCTSDNVKIVDDRPCPTGETCQKSDKPTKPCAPYNR